MNFFNLVCLTVVSLAFIGCSDSEGEATLHNQGESCLSCHGPNGTVEYDDRFTSGATVYTEINSTDSYARGYRIRLVLANTGTVINYETDDEGGTGNSYTEYPEGSINDFTAQVINSSGTVVNSSNTLHTADRIDCNLCHTQSGTNGAPGRIVSYDYYASLNDLNTSLDGNISFSSSVMTILENNCKSCHTVGGIGAPFIITDATTTYNYIDTNNLVNTADANSSTILQKATNEVVHGGGEQITTQSSEYQTISNWINQGALNN